MSNETHSRHSLSSPESDKGKESTPDADNPAANRATCYYIVFTIDDKAESWPQSRLGPGVNTNIPRIRERGHSFLLVWVTPITVRQDVCALVGCRRYLTSSR